MERKNQSVIRFPKENTLFISNSIISVECTICWYMCINILCNQLIHCWNQSKLKYIPCTGRFYRLPLPLPNKMCFYKVYFFYKTGYHNKVGKLFRKYCLPEHFSQIISVKYDVDTGFFMGGGQYSAKKTIKKSII